MNTHTDRGRTGAMIKYSRHDTRQKIPQQGTNTREIYDILISHSHFTVKQKSDRYAIYYLRDMYGMEIIACGHNMYSLWENK